MPSAAPIRQLPAEIQAALSSDIGQRQRAKQVARSTARAGMNRFEAIYLIDGSIRRIAFEAENTEEAQRLAAKLGFGLIGDAHEESILPQEQPVDPKAYDSTNARRLLGGISRTSLYRLLARGKLDRLPDTRKILVTRASIDRYCARAR
ncbi:MAG TPA: hypothetical protein VMB21_04710 [Candidatus Limnocylindria bacterium]|jgi:hypothetical protein|nr:hypothetical protein [Candidatus Limnocylindria bacterium]HTL67226.1 hypothetical protein [Lacunisphaera sp.]